MKDLRSYLLSAFFVIVFVCLASYSLVSRTNMEWLFTHGSYFLISLLVGIWVYSCIRWWKSLHVDVRGLTREYGVGVVAVTALCWALWFAVGPSYKVLSDETNLLAVARSMFFDKTIYNTTMGFWYYGNFWGSNPEMPTRPLLYPFLVQIFHLLFGYSYKNGFIANGVLLSLCLSFIYIMVSKAWGKISAAAAVLLVLSQPIVLISATSAGYDLLSAFLQLGILALVYQFLERKDPHSFFFMWFTGALLVNTRYEAMVFFLVIFGLLFALRRIRWNTIKPYFPLYLATPVIFLSRCWQVYLLPDKFENPQNVAPFGFGHLVDHVKICLGDLVTYDLQSPFAIAVNLTVLIVICVLLVLFVFKKKRFKNREHRDFVLIGLALILANLGIYFAHHFGVFSHPTQARPFLPFVMTLSLAAVLLRYFFKALTPKRLLAAGIMALVFYVPTAVEGRFSNKLILIRKTNAVLDFFHKLNNQNIMIVVDRPGQYTVEEWGAVDFGWAKGNSEKILADLARHLYQEAYIVEDIEYRDHLARSQFAGYFALETVFELQNTDSAFVRISKIQGRKWEKKLGPVQ